MHLSISSSNDRLPAGHWPVVWISSIVLFLLALIFIEYDIRRSGWTPSVVDSQQLWAKQRKRASELKDQAVILVGKSRIQLGMDLDAIKQVSQKEPVQLAIDGTPLMPVLYNLAQDPNVTGTVIVSITSGLSFDITESRSSEWIKSYQDRYSKNREPYKIINEAMMAFFDNNMITRLEGAKPFTIISSLAFKAPSLGNYLVTHQNRSRDADYKKVQMPHFYLTRAQRHFGENLVNGAVSIEQFLSIYEQAINNLQPKDNSQFLVGLNSLMNLIHTIEKRGGEVVLVRFPTSGLILKMDRKRYPKDMFWNELEKRHQRTIHFTDYPSLSKFSLPDGSHLDYRDKLEFTNSLMKIMLSMKI